MKITDTDRLNWILSQVIVTVDSIGFGGRSKVAFANYKQPKRKSKAAIDAAIRADAKKRKERTDGQ